MDALEKGWRGAVEAGSCEATMTSMCGPGQMRRLQSKRVSMRKLLESRKFNPLGTEGPVVALHDIASARTLDQSEIILG